MILLLLSAFASAQETVSKSVDQPASTPAVSQLGFGFALGTPTGVGCKYYLDNRNRVLERSGYAIQATLGGGLGSVGDVSASADVLYQMKPLNDVNDGYRLPIYYGVGLTGGLNLQQNMMRGGLRVVAGLVVAIDDLPFEVALESGASLLLVDTPTGDSLGHMMLGQIAFRHF